MRTQSVSGEEVFNPLTQKNLTTGAKKGDEPKTENRILIGNLTFRTKSQEKEKIEKWQDW